MRLLSVELTRLRSRRAVVVLVVGALAITVVALLISLWAQRPVSSSELAAAQQQVDAEAEQPYVARELRRCEKSPESYLGPDSTAEECADIVLPQVEWYLSRNQLDVVGLTADLPVGIALFGAVVAVLIGSTMIGAEWSAGSVGTQLVFESRRTRVWAAKGLAIGIGTAALALAVYVVTWSGLLIANSAWVDRPLPAGFVGDLVAPGLRVVCFVALAGVLGFAITMAARATVVVVGVMLAYVVVAETLLRNVWLPSERWLISTQTLAWVQDGYTIVRYPNDCFDEVSCQPTEQHLGLLDAAVYFGVVAAAVLGVSLLVFRRRDVP